MYYVTISTFIMTAELFYIGQVNNKINNLRKKKYR